MGSLRVVLGIAIGWSVGCGGTGTAPTPASPVVPAASAGCRLDRSCVELVVAGRTLIRPVARDRVVTIDDGGRQRQVVPLAGLIDREAVADPARCRYKMYATDGFTHGGFATWTNLEHGYLDVESRKTVFDPDQGLAHSFRVKDMFRIEVSCR